ncbi:MAG TPA: nodulation protein NfeD [Candidatus Angelobacter sp.]|jgi:membrane-bound serine protease (ClpP class)|nr:nodulation protein NfeD [Candidatus Angelobacter sp.]
MRINLLARFAAILAICLGPLAASADVLKIVVDDTIHPLIVERIDRAIQEAQNTHAAALLIELRTPGGLVSSMQEIVQKILASPVPVIIYVTPAGATAASAGFYILESADVAAMAPGTNTGVAHPVLGGAIMDPVLKEKLENFAAGFMRSYSAKRGRNVEAAESAVRQSKSFTADEALAQHLIDYIARDENDLFRQLDGKTITRFDGSKSVLHTAGINVRFYDMTVKQHMLSVLMNPNLILPLFAIGVLLLIFEFNHPGAVAPGVIGFFAVLLSLFALNMLPTSYSALVMIVGAFVLFALEAKFQTHGVLGILGITLMVIGGLLLVDGPIPQMRVKWATALSVALPLGFITIFLMIKIFQARQNKVVTGEQGMIGEIGVVSAPLAPVGKVFVHGELWDAIASSTVEVGQAVVVRKIEDFKLYVEPAGQNRVIG